MARAKSAGPRVAEVAPGPGAKNGSAVQPAGSIEALQEENRRLLAELDEERGERARLRSELDKRAAEQAATSDILRLIASSPTELQHVLAGIAERSARLTQSPNAIVFRLVGEDLRPVSHFQNGEFLTETFTHPLTRESLAGRAVVDRCTVHVPDLQAAADDFPRTRARARRTDQRASLATPLLSDGHAIGAIVVLRRGDARPYAPQEITLLETFAAQAVIAIQNAGLFAELHESNRTLQVALEQQTATAEVLRMISGAPGDLYPVFSAVIESAVRLCAATDGRIYLRAGDVYRGVAGYGATGASDHREFAGRALPVTHRTVTGAVLRSAETLHIHDIHLRREAFPDQSPRTYTAEGVHSLLGVPLLRDGVAVGVILVGRGEVRPFTDAEIGLVQTFASQAVIAIENARLFNELQERDERRRQELERASAIQQRLLPSSLEGWPGTLEVAVRFRAAVETSGDFYDVLALPPPHKGALEPLQIAVGDVAGKGMSAALVTALARAALHSTASVPTQMATPAGTLRVAGSRLHRDVGSSHFVACALAVVEPPGAHHAGPRLRLANAAQVPVLLVRNGQARESEPPGYRLPLGAQPDGDYKDVEVDLLPGDLVVFSSDGLVEAPALPTVSADTHLPPPECPGELFGFARLAASATHWASHVATAENVAAGIWRDLTAWCGEESHHDDMTLLVLRAVG